MNFDYVFVFSYHFALDTFNERTTLTWFSIFYLLPPEKQVNLPFAQKYKHTCACFHRICSIFLLDTLIYIPTEINISNLKIPTKKNRNPSRPSYSHFLCVYRLVVVLFSRRNFVYIVVDVDFCDLIAIRNIYIFRNDFPFCQHFAHWWTGLHT